MMNTIFIGNLGSSIFLLYDNQYNVFHKTSKNMSDSANNELNCFCRETNSFYLQNIEFFSGLYADPIDFSNGI